MSAETLPAVAALSRRYLQDYPREAARRLERLAPGEIAELLLPLPLHVALPVWQALMPDVAAAMLAGIPADVAARWLAEADPPTAAAVLAQLDEEARAKCLSGADPEVAAELRALVAYPEDVAGRIMDPNVAPLRADASVGDALQRLKAIRRRGLREMFVVDDARQLAGRVEIHDLAVTDPAVPLREVTRPPIAVVGELDPREDLVAILQHQPINEVPVVDAHGRFVGVIQHTALLAAVAQETTVARHPRACRPPRIAPRPTPSRAGYAALRSVRRRTARRGEGEVQRLGILRGFHELCQRSRHAPPRDVLPCSAGLGRARMPGAARRERHGGPASPGRAGRQ